MNDGWMIFFFEKMMTVLLYKKKRFYTIHRGDYKHKTSSDLHTNCVFYASPRLVVNGLNWTLFLQASTPNIGTIWN